MGGAVHSALNGGSGMDIVKAGAVGAVGGAIGGAFGGWMFGRLGGTVATRMITTGVGASVVGGIPARFTSSMFSTGNFQSSILSAVNPREMALNVFSGALGGAVGYGSHRALLASPQTRAVYQDFLSKMAAMKRCGDAKAKVSKQEVLKPDEVKVVKGAEADIGNKLDYILGKATGNTHNIERSQAMANELKRIGIQDTLANRALLQEHLDGVVSNPNNIARTEAKSYIAKELSGQPTVKYTATIRESFFMGPDGGVKFETVWEGNRLLTIIIKGGQ